MKWNVENEINTQMGSNKIDGWDDLKDLWDPHNNILKVLVVDQHKITSKSTTIKKMNWMWMEWHLWYLLFFEQEWTRHGSCHDKCKFY